MVEKPKNTTDECDFCEGKGYTQIQSCYDEPQSREDCPYCYGGKKDNTK